MQTYSNKPLDRLNLGIPAQKSISYPRKIYLDLTQDCNLYCIMCRNEIQICGKTMDLELYKRLVDETCPYISGYSLFNWGEPLLLDDFKERVEYLLLKKEPDTVVEISTNGMLLNEEMIEFLTRNNIRVIVSFDVADKGTFEKIRRGSNFERICNNIKNLVKNAHNLPINLQPELYVSIQEANLTQLLEIVKLGFSFGIKVFGFGFVTNPDNLAVKDLESAKNIFESVINYAKKNDLLLTILPYKIGNYLFDGSRYVSKDEYILDTNCNAPSTICSVAYNGDVYLCCNAGAVVDNVSDKTLKEIWTSNRYGVYREQVNDSKNMPDLCRSCFWVNRY